MGYEIVRRLGITILEFDEPVQVSKQIEIHQIIPLRKSPGQRCTESLHLLQDWHDNYTRFPCLINPNSPLKDEEETTPSWRKGDCPGAIDHPYTQTITGTEEPYHSCRRGEGLLVGVSRVAPPRDGNIPGTQKTAPSMRPTTPGEARHTYFPFFLRRPTVNSLSHSQCT